MQLQNIITPVRCRATAVVTTFGREDGVGGEGLGFGGVLGVWRG